MDTHNVDLDHLQEDQAVYTSDGQKLGNVAGVNVNIDTGEQYLEVASGLFKVLHVPKSEIEYAEFAKPVRLKVPHDQAEERFSERPNLI